MGGLGDLLVGREAEAAPSIVEAPKKRLQHRQRLRRDDAIGPALLRPAAQAARPLPDPDLGVAVEFAGRQGTS
jgi:hypothetical protein